MPKPFIMAVLNEARWHKKTSFAVNAPLLDIDLLGINLDGPSVDWIVDEARYDKVFSETQTKLGDPQLVREIPSYSDLKEAFQSSLLVPPTNLDELTKEMRGMEERRNHPSRYPRQMCLALDTNIAYKRLFSRLTIGSEGCGIRDYDPTRIQLLIPDLVEREVSEKVNRKYRQPEIELFKKAFKNPKLASNLMNCCYKEGRKALNAQAELGALRELYATWEVTGGVWTEDKERRDGEILRTLAKHSQVENMDMLFISADDKATAAARAAKVPIMVIRYPYDMPRMVAYDPWLFVELLFDLSILYTVVNLKGVGVRIHGDWGGKTAEDYRAERVKVVSEESSPIIEALARDHRVMQRLEKELDLKNIR